MRTVCGLKQRGLEVRLQQDRPGFTRLHHPRNGQHFSVGKLRGRGGSRHKCREVEFAISVPVELRQCFTRRVLNLLRMFFLPKRR